MFKDGITGGLEGIKQQTIKIAQLIAPYPVSVEVTTNDPKNMVIQARDFAQWAENVVVKITIHGPNGELDNMSVIHDLETKYDDFVKSRHSRVGGNPGFM